MRRKLTTCLALVFALFLADETSAASDFSKPKKAVLPHVDQAPVIDGKLDDEMWKKASKATNFLDLSRIKKTVSEQTDALMARDDENLYFGFICDSHAPSEIKAETTKEKRDFLRVYKDDCVELFLDTEHSKNDFYHWIINVNGAIFDEVRHRLIYTEKMLSSPEWNSTAEAAGSRGDGKWFVEMKIPLSDFSERDLKALKNDETWGVQFGRENWSAPSGKPEYSLWSSSYSFVEPEGFGVVTFSGDRTDEQREKWEQTVDESMAFMNPPTRPDYVFEKFFDFGPTPKEEDVKGEQPQATMDAPGAKSPAQYEKLIEVGPATLFSDSKTKGFGFTSEQGLKAMRNNKRKFYGGRLSPVSADYIMSKDPAEFQFDLPAGRYQAVFVCAKDIITGPSGSGVLNFTIDVNGSRKSVYNQYAGKFFLPVWVGFETDGKEPVSVKFIPAQHGEWAIKGFGVCEEKDFAIARQAYYWIQRDNYNYPFEKIVRETAAWIDIPASNIQPGVTPEEKTAGFAAFALSPSAFVPQSYIPEKSDSRGKAVAITSPGRTTGLMMGFHALKPFKNLTAKLEKRPADGVAAHALQVNHKIGRIGKSTLKQKGFVPSLLTRIEPTALEENRTQAYFIDVQVGENVSPGVYKGTVGFYDDDEKLRDLPFELIVLPFDPENKQNKIRSIFFNPPICENQAKGKTGADLEPFIKMTRDQLRDLKRHGINNVHAYANSGSYQLEEDGKYHFRPREQDLIFWRMLKEEGINELAVTIPILEGIFGAKMINDYLEQAGSDARVTSMTTRYLCKDELPPKFFDNLKLLIKENIEEREKRGYGVPAFDIWDEPGHLNSEAYAPILDAVHKAGGKTCVQTLYACYPVLSDKVDIRTYDMGSIAVNGSEALNPEEVRKIKKEKGCVYSVYPNGAIMGSDPRAPRQMYGYFGWAWNLDGIDPYKYYKISGDYLLGKSFHPVLFDENGDVLMTTLNWKNFAEGIYDNDLVQEMESHATEPDSTECSEFVENLRKSAAFHPAFIHRGQDSMTLAPKYNDFNWFPRRFDLMRTVMAIQLMKLKGLDESYPKIMTALEDNEKELRVGLANMKKSQNVNVPPARQGNLIRNGGFEESPMETKGSGYRDLAGFRQVSPNAHVQGEEKHAGEKALQFEHDKTVGWDNAKTKMIKLVPGRAYKFSGWAKRDAERKEDTALWTGFQIKTYEKTAYEDKSKDHFIQRRGLWFPQSQPSFDWMKFEYPFTAGQSENFVYVTLYDNDERGTIYFDDLELIEYGGDQ